MKYAWLPFLILLAACNTPRSKQSISTTPPVADSCIYEPCCDGVERTTKNQAAHSEKFVEVSTFADLDSVVVIHAFEEMRTVDVYFRLQNPDLKIKPLKVRTGNGYAIPILPLMSENILGGLTIGTENIRKVNLSMERKIYTRRLTAILDCEVDGKPMKKTMRFKLLICE